MKTAQSTCLAVAMAAVLSACGSLPDVENRLQGIKFHPNLYVVQAGDTLDTIAYRYRLPREQLVAMNPATVNGRVLPGQRLNVRPGTVLSDDVRNGQFPFAGDNTVLPASARAQTQQYGADPALDAALVGTAVPTQLPTAQPSVQSLPPNTAVSVQAVPVDGSVPRQPAMVAAAPQSLPAVVPDNSAQQAAAMFPREAAQYSDTRDDGTPYEQVVSSETPMQLALNEYPVAQRAPVVIEVPASVSAPQSVNGVEVLGANPAVRTISPSEAADPSADTASGTWPWPTEGVVARGFLPDQPNGKGIDIAGVPGQPVMAVAAGVVEYAGRDMSGHGNLIVVKHPGDLLTVYSHADELYVSAREQVQAGDPIATLGWNENKESVLDFSVQQHGRAQNPMHYLIAR